MCNCQKEAKVFLNCSKMFWGWFCKCRNTWMVKNIRHISLDDIKPELIPKEVV